MNNPTGLQPIPDDEYELPPQEGVPEGALYGVINFDTNQWAGDFFYNIREAQNAADAVNRSGLPLAVISIDGREYFESSGF